MADVNIMLAFGAGVLSFVSPCTLPLYPAFLSYITGVSLDELKEKQGMLQKRAIMHTAFFLLGFSIIFVVLGLSTSFIGALFVQYSDLIRRIGSILIVFMGLVIVGAIQPKFMMKDSTIAFRNRPAGYLGSSLIGLAFAAGWTPCMGPILAAVIALSMTNPGSGFLYMMVYTLGFAIPFFLLAFFIGRMNWIRKFSNKIMKIGGYAMIFVGIFLFFGWMTKITSFLTNTVFDGFMGF